MAKIKNSEELGEEQIKEDMRKMSDAEMFRRLKDLQQKLWDKEDLKSLAAVERLVKKFKTNKRNHKSLIDEAFTCSS